MSGPKDLCVKIGRWRVDIALIGLEACPLSEWICGALATADYDVRCLETRHKQRILSTRPNKTDRSDAHGIAFMIRVDHYKPVYVGAQAGHRHAQDAAQGRAVPAREGGSHPEIALVRQDTLCPA